VKELGVELRKGVEVAARDLEPHDGRAHEGSSCIRRTVCCFACTDRLTGSGDNPLSGFPGAVV
jgi:hypothetical protein